MSQHPSIPETMPVIYTLEHISTVPTEDWHAFVLAVTELFWQLPEALRPISQDKRFGAVVRAAELFPEPSMLVFCGEMAMPVCLTVERERSRNVLEVQELDFQRQPCDFFARVVMLLLHHLCPGHFNVHSSLGYRSWILPQLWAERHLNMSLTAPQQPISPFEVDAKVVGSMSRLLLALLSDTVRNLSREQWVLIAESEIHLYQPATTITD